MDHFGTQNQMKEFCDKTPEEQASPHYAPKIFPTEYKSTKFTGNELY